MIFGFNSEVSCAGTHYHVQSELRSRESLMQTQVFVSGRCIGKISAPILAGTTEADAQELLREQHRRIVAAARENGIQELLEEHSDGLRLAWEGDGPTYGRGKVRLHLVVSNSGEPVAGAEVNIRIEGDANALQALGTSDSRGHARLSVAMDEQELPGCLLTVETACGDRRTVRRYQLQRRNGAPPPTK